MGYGLSLCKASECNRETGKHGAKGLCSKHYKRFRATGQYETTTILVGVHTNEERLAHVGWTVTDSGCWEWKGTRDKDGYGTVSVVRVPRRVHRLAYAEWVGPLDPAQYVCHTCDNPPCLNPDHLFVGTPSDNTQDMLAKDRKPRDEASHLCKIPAHDALRIRELYATGDYTQRGLARMFNISQAQISNIVLGKQRRRSHIPLRNVA